MVLLPKVVGVLMEGLNPIGKSAKEIMQKQMGKDAELNIGMDCALALGSGDGHRDSHYHSFNHAMCSGIT